MVQFGVSIPFEVGPVALGAAAVAVDFDGDGAVDFADFQILAANFGRDDDVGLESGDTNGDGVVDFADFLTLSANLYSHLSEANVDELFAANG